eukprot:CFRG0508T1
MTQEGKPGRKHSRTDLNIQLKGSVKLFEQKQVQNKYGCTNEKKSCRHVLENGGAFVTITPEKENGTYEVEIVRSRRRFGVENRSY